MCRHVAAAPAQVYRALLDPDAVRRWMVPDGMSSEVHAFEAHEGGEFRISLTYQAPTSTGKTTAQTDSFHGHFVRLVPEREVVQEVQFDTPDPSLRGVMTISYLLSAVGEGTRVEGVHENLPPGLSPAENELGWTMSLDKLARFVEGQ